MTFLGREGGHYNIIREYEKKMIWVVLRSWKGMEDTKYHFHKSLCTPRKLQIRVKLISYLLVHLRTIVIVIVNSNLYEYDI